MKKYKLDDSVLNTEELLKSLIAIKESLLLCYEDKETKFTQQKLILAIAEFLTKPLKEIK